MTAKRFSVDAIFKAVDRMSKPVANMQPVVDRFARQVNERLAALESEQKK